jgi:hypothetical protein
VDRDDEGNLDFACRRPPRARCAPHSPLSMTTRSVTIRGGTYPVILPSIRDPRLHVAAVIITIHVLGQLGLDFRVSIPQILAAILTCAVLEVALTFRQAHAFVWPASAMLTGSGVALILRVVGTPADDPWTTYGWYVFAAVAGLSLLSKYVIRYRGSHVFNPSNIGLVVAFIVLGSTRVEPLDFWWAPLNAWMITAYAVILVGGLLITRRLKLLELAASFWIGLAVGLGLLAASGHCMTANWAFAPVCGYDFWRVVVTSPEVLIFLFFMITDPKTVPSGRVGRIAFGLLVALASTLLMAPQTDEFGAKVGLLAGLVVVCVARPLVDHLAPKPSSTDDDPARFASELAAGGSLALPRRAARLGITALAVVLIGGGIVAAGTPARGVAVVGTEDPFDRDPTTVDPATLPVITVGQDVVEFDHELAGAGMQEVVVTLAQNLELENQALLRREDPILVAVDHGDRLVEMRALLDQAIVDGTTVLTHYDFDTIDVSLLVPFGAQDGLSLGLAGRGTMIEETRDAAGAVLSRESSPFDLTFAMRRATGTRWMNVAVLPAGG